MIQRLRRVLEANYRIQVESSNNLIAKVNRKKNKRRRDLQSKHVPVPTSKDAAVLNALRGRRDWEIRAIDLLHKIGFLTTPSWVNMARLSASWATRRYFWAIAEPSDGEVRFRLSDDARKMDFHQKTLLSDEFGIGVAGLLLERYFVAASFVDISVALGDPGAYQEIEHEGEAQPDYLMWGDGENSPYYVVECKGTQSSRNTSYDQLRRGLEQVPTIVLGAGPRQIVTLVVATCLLADGTEVFVLDPPPDSPEGDRPDKRLSDGVSERTGKRAWRILNPVAFSERSIIAEESNLLKWAGQYSTANMRERRLDRIAPQLVGMPNAPLETKRTNFGRFSGVEQPLFPELGTPGLRIFTGVEHDLLDSLIRQPPEARRVDQPRQIEVPDPNQLPATVSVSGSGSCMIIDGL